MKKVHEYDFRDGDQIFPSEINKFHQEVLRKLNEENAQYYSLATGNGLVIGRRDNKRIVIYEVSNGYKTFEYETTNP